MGFHIFGELHRPIDVRNGRALASVRRTSRSKYRQNLWWCQGRSYARQVNLNTQNIHGVQTQPRAAHLARLSGGF